MFQSKGKKNIKKLRSAIEIALNARAPSNMLNGAVLCKNYVLAKFDVIASNKQSEKECSEYGDDFDYERAAYNMIYNICERGLASGSLNVCPGILTPEGEALNGLVHNVINHFEKNGWLSKKDCESAKKYILDGINTYG